MAPDFFIKNAMKGYKEKVEATVKANDYGAFTKVFEQLVSDSHQGNEAATRYLNRLLHLLKPTGYTQGEGLPETFRHEEVIAPAKDQFDALVKDYHAVHEDEQPAQINVTRR